MKTLWACVAVIAASVLFSSSDSQAAWKETVLVSFNGTNGQDPDGRLVFDAKGNLYGTTFHSGTCATGSSGCGTVFKLTPPAAGKTTWTQTVLYSFKAADGANPSGNLTFDRAGNLYGTTNAGGAFGFGTIFKLSPPAAGKTAWTETVLFSFNGTDGSNPGNLIFDAKSALYGTTTFGGGTVQCEGSNGPLGCGTVFKLSPPAAGKTAWTQAILYSFNGTNGAVPQGLIFDAAGNLYGATGGSPAFGVENVFKLTPPSTGKTAWTETVLHTFSGGVDGYLSGGLVFDRAGNLYGTTTYGSTSAGSVFELAPPAAGKTTWTESVLISFQGTNGDNPDGGLIIDAAGNLYGTTNSGGGFKFNFSGNVFKLAPPAAGKSVWMESVLAQFNGANGEFPSTGLTFDGVGNLYGTTFSGGKSGDGVVFKLTP